MSEAHRQEMITPDPLKTTERKVPGTSDTYKSFDDYIKENRVSKNAETILRKYNDLILSNRRKKPGQADKVSIPTINVSTPFIELANNKTPETPENDPTFAAKVKADTKRVLQQVFQTNMRNCERYSQTLLRKRSSSSRATTQKSNNTTDTVDVAAGNNDDGEKSDDDENLCKLTEKDFKVLFENDDIDESEEIFEAHLLKAKQEFDREQEEK